MRINVFKRKQYTYVSVVQGVSQEDEVTIAGLEGRILFLSELLRAVVVVLDANDGERLSEDRGVGVANAITHKGEKGCEVEDKAGGLQDGEVLVGRLMARPDDGVNGVGNWGGRQLHEQTVLGDSSPRSTYPTTG